MSSHPDLYASSYQTKAREQRLWEEYEDTRRECRPRRTERHGRWADCSLLLWSGLHGLEGSMQDDTKLWLARLSDGGG